MIEKLVEWFGIVAVMLHSFLRWYWDCWKIVAEIEVS